MPLKELFKREQIKTIAADSAGRSFYDLLLSCACMSFSLESYKAQGAYLRARNSPHCTPGLRYLYSLLLHEKCKAIKGILGKEVRRTQGTPVIKNLPCVLEYFQTRTRIQIYYLCLLSMCVSIYQYICLYIYLILFKSSSI